MSKRGVVAYIKPDEPSFIKRLKLQAGYKEGPTVHTKFETLPGVNETSTDSEDEEPQVVVLKPGDLTKEEADVEKKIKIEEQESEPADLTKRIIFKPKKKINELKKSTSHVETNESTKKTLKPSLLSFDDDDDNDDDDEGSD